MWLFPCHRVIQLPLITDLLLAYGIPFIYSNGGVCLTTNGLNKLFDNEVQSHYKREEFIFYPYVKTHLDVLK